MKRRFALGAFLALGLAFTSLHQAKADDAAKLDPQNTIYLDIKDGRVVIKLRPDLAPLHVARIKQLVHEHFYDGLVFHRVIDGFMAQTGDPTGTGEGGSKYGNVKAEFSDSAHFLRGTVGAARTPDDPDSANSQFFIMFAPNTHLDGQYTIWGQVVSGMEFVDKINRGDGDSGMVTQPDHIIKMQLAADAK